MANLRAINFDELLDIYSEIKNLVKRCNGIVRSAIGKISRQLYLLTNHQGCDEIYWERLSYAATRLDILYNSNIDGIIKEIILKIYNKITAILPENFQLLLFVKESEFGWNFKINKTDWEAKSIRYTPNKFWDGLKKLFPLMRSKVQSVLSSENQYTQMSLNFEV